MKPNEIIKSIEKEIEEDERIINKNFKKSEIKADLLLTNKRVVYNEISKAKLETAKQMKESFIEMIDKFKRECFGDEWSVLKRLKQEVQNE